MAAGTRPSAALAGVQRLLRDGPAAYRLDHQMPKKPAVNPRIIALICVLAVLTMFAGSIADQPCRRQGRRTRCAGGRRQRNAAIGPSEPVLKGVGPLQALATNSSIFLRPALGHQEIVIAAARRSREFAADLRVRLIDRAAAFLRVEELADITEMLVLLAAHGEFGAVLRLGELRLGGAIAQPEMLRQPLDIGLLELDKRIGTAIARTVRAVVLDWPRKHLRLSRLQGFGGVSYGKRLCHLGAQRQYPASPYQEANSSKPGTSVALASSSMANLHHGGTAGRRGRA